MAKPIYKLLDEKGRVLIPKQLRIKAEMESGDIVKLDCSNGKVTVAKVDIVEAGSQDPQSVETFIHAAAKSMGRDKQVEIASKILKLAEENREGI